MLDFFSMTIDVSELKTEKKAGNDASGSDDEIILSDGKFDSEDSNRWTMSVDYPLVFFADKERPQELDVMHLTKGVKERVILYQQDLTLKFVCFAKVVDHKAGTQVYYIAQGKSDDGNDGDGLKMYLCEVGLKRPFLRKSMTTADQWTYEKQELPKTFSKIGELKGKLLNVFVMRQGEYTLAVV